MHLFKAIASTWAVGQSWSMYSLSIGCFGSSHVKLKLVTIMLPIFASPLTLSQSLSFSCPERVYTPLPAGLWQALSVKYSTVPPSPKTCTMAGAKRRIQKRGLISFVITKFHRYKLGLKEDGKGFNRKELQICFFINEEQQPCAIPNSSRAGYCICSIYQIRGCIREVAYNLYQPK
jgi:hypothetical protein